jgi:hypothetical protein
MPKNTNRQVRQGIKGKKPSPRDLPMARDEYWSSEPFPELPKKLPESWEVHFSKATNTFNGLEVKMNKSLVLILIAGVLIVAACGPVTPAPAAPVKETSTPGSATQSPSQDEMVRLSTAFLVQQFKLAQDAVKVKEVTPMTWPDASLGCPKRGVMYIQVLTPGFQVVLEADGHAFTFHTDAKDRVVLCTVNPPDEAFATPDM